MYDKRLPLTIDPSFVYSTEFGGGDDFTTAIAVDQEGSAYIAGATVSASFPTVQAIQSVKKDKYTPIENDAFITKLNPAGNAIVYSTYLGGTADDAAHSIAVDETGAYVSGETTSTDFPVANALLSSPTSGFVAKLNADGSALAYSTYFEGGNAIAADASHAAYVQGGISINTFLSKIDPTGTSINFATQFGDGTNHIAAIALDSVTGDIVVTGTTRSLTLPTLNAFQTARVATSSATGFVTKFNSAGNALLYSTYLGGSVDDRPAAVALDANGTAYITGTSASKDFPITAGALEPLVVSSCFVTELGTNGEFLLSTFFGGHFASSCNGIAVDTSGSVLVAGTALFPFPLLGTLQTDTNVSSQYAFVTKFTPDLSSLMYSTLVGLNSQGQALALDASGNAYLAANAVWPGTFPIVKSSKFGPLGNDENIGVSKIMDDAACASLHVSPTNFVFDSLGGSGIVNVSAPAGCVWSAVGDSFANPAISVTQSPFATFTGNGAIDFSVGSTGANQPTAVGYLVIAGRRITIMQSGNSPSPFLSISKSHSGNFAPGQQNALYTLIVSNAAGATPTSGTVTVTESVPPLLTLVSMAGNGWTCPSTAPNNCSRHDALPAGANYPPIQVTVNVAANASGSIGNLVTVSGGGAAAANATDIAVVNRVPDFALDVSPGSRSVAAGGNTLYTVAVSGVNGFSGTVSLGVSGLPSGASVNFVPSSLTGSGSNILTISTLANTTRGTFTLTVTGTSGGLTHSATTTLIVAAPTGASATFLRQDTVTQGNWRGVYGADGYAVIGDLTSNPNYVTPVESGAGQAVWPNSPTDIRALQMASNPAARIAGVWYTSTSFMVDLNITDSNTHQVALYCLDWDRLGRSETVTILDANGNAINTQIATGLGGGVYLVWNVSGHVKIQVTLTGGANAVATGLFFGAGGTVGSSTGTAAFVKQDTATQGNWQGVYGADGYAVVGDLISNPSYVTPVATGEGQVVWPNSPTDVRALQMASNPANRIAGVWYTATSFTVDLNITDSNTHQVALYCLDWDRAGRSETVAITDANGNALTSRSMTNFGAGVYLVWNVSGHVKIQVTLTGGANAVATGLFFGGGGTVVSTTGTAVLVKQDSATQGNWQGVYGADGYVVIGDLTSNPTYVTPVPSGEGQVAWPNSPGDVRALQMASNPAGRIAGVWYTATSFTVDLNITGNNTHQVALYCLDWDREGRSETVAITDANGNVLNTQSVTNFGAGVYVVWNVSGHVKVQVTLSGGANAVVTGLFFGGGGTLTNPTGTAAFVKQDSVTEGNWQGVYGADGFVVIGDLTSNPSYVTPAATGEGQVAWPNSPTDIRALQKASNPASRIAGVWYTSTAFTVDLNITDNDTHQIAVYCLDWDRAGRSETVAVTDANGAVLNSQSVTNFGGGVYLVWNVSGHVKIQVTRTGGPNAVTTGLFFH